MDKALRHERILDCRYYNGEKEAPEGVNGLFWGYECGWANNPNDHWECEKEDLERLGIAYFDSEDGTPYELKCLLFNRYCHWVGLYGGPENFLKWYREDYQQPRKTNRQRRAELRKKELIKRCRYYKGEPENPFKNTDKEMIWYYESCWVDQLSNSYKNAESFRWEAKGLKEFAEKYNIPLSLLGLFLNRYEHWATMGNLNINDFISWVKHCYLNIGHDAT